MASIFILFFVCVFCVFSVICFELSVPVQVIAWKDLDGLISEIIYYLLSKT